MSQVYSTEPAITGRVVFETTHGPIDVNLFCKECPTTTRTFLQLCLDGYYDGMIFHRILSDFLIQTGLTRDETLSGTPAKEIDQYLRGSSAVPSASSQTRTGDVLGWERKKLELNPRIRFNHRGQVAAAFPLEESGDGTENDEESAMLRYQFFVTLDESPFLDGKHVVFGTIAGPTIFNALRIGKTEADETTGIPVDMRECPPRIKSVKVDHHPFDDLVITSERSIPWRIATKDGGSGGNGRGQSAVEKRRKKRKGKRDLNVLSFGDEELAFEPVLEKDGKKKGGGGGGAMQSSHDVLGKESKFLSSSVDKDVEKRIADEKEIVKSTGNGKSSGDQKVSFAAAEAEPTSNKPVASQSAQRVQHDTLSKRVTTNDDDKDERQRSKDKKDRKRGSESSRSRDVGAVEARRAKYLKSGAASLASKKEKLKREDDTMAKLLAFKSKVIETKGPKTNESGGKRDDAKKPPVDASLAARMAKRTQQDEEDADRRYKEEEAMVSRPGYSGQVNDGDSDDGIDTGDWMGTKFKCKKHIDHASRQTAMDNIGEGDENNVGGDGRRMDDYLVIDEKKRQGVDGSHHHKKNGSGGHRNRHYGSGRKPHSDSGGYHRR